MKDNYFILSDNHHDYNSSVFKSKQECKESLVDTSDNNINISNLSSPGTCIKYREKEICMYINNNNSNTDNYNNKEIEYDYAVNIILSFFNNLKIILNYLKFSVIICDNIRTKVDNISSNSISLKQKKLFKNTTFNKNLDYTNVLHSDVSSSNSHKKPSNLKNINPKKRMFLSALSYKQELIKFEHFINILIFIFSTICPIYTISYYHLDNNNNNNNNKNNSSLNISDLNSLSTSINYIVNILVYWTILLFLILCSCILKFYSNYINNQNFTKLKYSFFLIYTVIILILYLNIITNKLSFIESIRFIYLQIIIEIVVFPYLRFTDNIIYITVNTFILFIQIFVTQISCSSCLSTEHILNLLSCTLLVINFGQPKYELTIDEISNDLKVSPTTNKLKKLKFINNNEKNNNNNVNLQSNKNSLNIKHSSKVLKNSNNFILNNCSVSSKNIINLKRLKSHKSENSLKKDTSYLNYKNKRYLGSCRTNNNKLLKKVDAYHSVKKPTNMYKYMSLSAKNLNPINNLARVHSSRNSIKRNHSNSISYDSSSNMFTSYYKYNYNNKRNYSAINLLKNIKLSKCFNQKNTISNYSSGYDTSSDNNNLKIQYNKKRKISIYSKNSLYDNLKPYKSSSLISNELNAENTDIDNIILKKSTNKSLSVPTKQDKLNFKLLEKDFNLKSKIKFKNSLSSKLINNKNSGIFYNSTCISKINNNYSSKIFSNLNGFNSLASLNTLNLMGVTVSYKSVLNDNLENSKDESNNNCFNSFGLNNKFNLSFKLNYVNSNLYQLFQDRILDDNLNIKIKDINSSNLLELYNINYLKEFKQEIYLNNLLDNDLNFILNKINIHGNSIIKTNSKDNLNYEDNNDAFKNLLASQKTSKFRSNENINYTNNISKTNLYDIIIEVIERDFKNTACSNEQYTVSNNKQDSKFKKKDTKKSFIFSEKLNNNLHYKEVNCNIFSRNNKYFRFQLINKSSTDNVSYQYVNTSNTLSVYNDLYYSANKHGLTSNSIGNKSSNKNNNKRLNYLLVLDDITTYVTVIKHYVYLLELKNTTSGLIAHDFKTPFNVISASMQEIKSKLALNLNVNEELEHVEGLCNYGVCLVDEFILSTKKNYTLNITKKPVDLSNILELCRKVMNALIVKKYERKNVKCELIIDNEIFNYIISTDELRLKQILLNFVSNAVKFSFRGTIKLICSINYIKAENNTNRSILNNSKKIDNKNIVCKTIKYTEDNKSNTDIYNNKLRLKNSLINNFNKSQDNKRIIHKNLSTKDTSKKLFLDDKKSLFKNKGIIKNIQPKNSIQSKNQLKNKIINDNYIKEIYIPIVKISVVDEGTGIENETLVKIKAGKFSDLNVERSINPEGTGLGLKFSKEIIDKLGYNFEIESIRGKGTKVSVLFSTGIQSKKKDNSVNSYKNILSKSNKDNCNNNDNSSIYKTKKLKRSYLSICKKYNSFKYREYLKRNYSKKMFDKTINFANTNINNNNNIFWDTNSLMNSRILKNIDNYILLSSINNKKSLINKRILSRVEGYYTRLKKAKFKFSKLKESNYKNNTIKRTNSLNLDELKSVQNKINKKKKYFNIDYLTSSNPFTSKKCINIQNSATKKISSDVLKAKKKYSLYTNYCNSPFNESKYSNNYINNKYHIDDNYNNKSTIQGLFQDINTLNLPCSLSINKYNKVNSRKYKKTEEFKLHLNELLKDDKDISVNSKMSINTYKNQEKNQIKKILSNKNIKINDLKINCTYIPDNCNKNTCSYQNETKSIFDCKNSLSESENEVLTERQTFKPDVNSLVNYLINKKNNNLKVYSNDELSEISNNNNNNNNKVIINLDNNKIESDKLKKYNFILSKKVISFELLTNKKLNLENISIKKHKNIILIVDDMSTIRNSFKNRISAAISNFYSDINSIEYNIICCKDGIDILYYVINDKDNCNIKCVFTDEVMEYFNGTDAISILKKYEYNNKLPKLPYLISCSGYDEETIKNKSNYFNEYLSKEFTKEDIINIFKKVNIFDV